MQLEMENSYDPPPPKKKTPEIVATSGMWHKLK